MNRSPSRKMSRFGVSSDTLSPALPAPAAIATTTIRAPVDPGVRVPHPRRRLLADWPKTLW